MRFTWGVQGASKVLGGFTEGAWGARKVLRRALWGLWGSYGRLGYVWGAKHIGSWGTCVSGGHIGCLGGTWGALWVLWRHLWCRVYMGYKGVHRGSHGLLGCPWGAWWVPLGCLGFL